MNIPPLLAVPAAVRFASPEPLLGPMNLTQLAQRGGTALDALRGEGFETFTGRTASGPGPRRVHLVVSGGESGPKARPMHPDWVRSLRDQCQSAGTPFFFKRWGHGRSQLIVTTTPRIGARITLRRFQNPASAS